MFDKVHVYVQATVDLVVDDVEDRQDVILFFWVNTSNEHDDAITQAYRECRHFGWTPRLPEHWKVVRTVTDGQYLCLSGQHRILKMPAC